jgi:hypothetical protein
MPKVHHIVKMATRICPEVLASFRERRKNSGVSSFKSHPLAKYSFTSLRASSLWLVEILSIQLICRCIALPAVCIKAAWAINNPDRGTRDTYVQERTTHALRERYPFLCTFSKIASFLSKRS